MALTRGVKTPGSTPKRKSAAESELMETAATENAITQKSPSNGSEKKSDSKKKKSLKRKLGDDDYEEIKDSETSFIEEDLNDSQKGSSKKQKKKKQRVDNDEENGSSDKTTGLSSADEKEDEKEGKNVPPECKLFVTSLGLEGMSKYELRDFFKSHGYNLVVNIKQIKSRHAFVGFATVKEATKAKESLDKIDCKGFPLSIDSKDLMLASLLLIKPKRARLINADGTADCSLYASPIAPTMTKQTLMNSFAGVVRVLRRGRMKSWVRLECDNSAVAKQLYKSHQGKVVEGTALRLETVEEFRRRITEEELEQVKQLKKQKQNEKKTEKKQKQTKKQEKKSEPEPKDSSDQSDDDDDDVRVVNDDDDDSEEEEAPRKLKKAKVTGKI